MKKLLILILTLLFSPPEVLAAGGNEGRGVDDFVLLGYVLKDELEPDELAKFDRTVTRLRQLVENGV
ncbi:MAG TPA: hypothetical protein VM598_14605, partial [Bdellovibrionota bacterium]|nr:hypothetical protein [Bdellovibrionota bacterium]